MAAERVLVVEDEGLIRMGIVQHLEDAGYDVLEASHAKEAIEILEANRDIRLVVTDIHMPGDMDGVKLAHYVRHRWPPIHLVVVSGGRLPSDAPLPEGALFFSKPYAEQSFVRAIGGLLGVGGVDPASASSP